MIFTEEDKAFIKIFVPYNMDCGLLQRVKKEFPGKRRNTFGLDNRITKLLIKGMSKRTHGVAYRRLRKTSDAIADRRSGIRIKACMLVNGGYF